MGTWDNFDITIFQTSFIILIIIRSISYLHLRIDFSQNFYGSPHDGFTRVVVDTADTY